MPQVVRSRQRAVSKSSKSCLDVLDESALAFALSDLEVGGREVARVEVCVAAECHALPGPHAVSAEAAEGYVIAGAMDEFRYAPAIAVPVAYAADLCCIAGGLPAAGNLGFVAEKEYAPTDVEVLCRVVESCMPNGAFDWEDRVEKVLDCGCHCCETCLLFWRTLRSELDRLPLPGCGDATTAEFTFDLCLLSSRSFLGLRAQEVPFLARAAAPAICEALPDAMESCRLCKDPLKSCQIYREVLDLLAIFLAEGAQGIIDCRIVRVR